MGGERRSGRDPSSVSIIDGWMGGSLEDNQRSSVTDEADKGNRLLDKAIWVLA